MDDCVQPLTVMAFFFWHFLAVTMVIGLATLQPLRDSVIYDLTPLYYPIFYFPGTTLKACSSAAPRLDTKVTLILITVCNTDPDTDIEGTKQNINSVSMSFFFSNVCVQSGPKASSSSVLVKT